MATCGQPVSHFRSFDRGFKGSMEYRGISWPQQLSKVWAKSGDETGWLSLQQHMVDSADVAGFLWEDWLAPSTKHLIASQWDLSLDESRQLVMFLSGSHDLGKADPVFVGQLADRPDVAYLVDNARAAGLTFPASLLNSRRTPHSHLSEVIIAQYLKDVGMSKMVANTYAAISGSHHGLPMAPSEQTLASMYLEQIYSEAPEWKALHFPTLQALASYTQASEILPQLNSTSLSAPNQMLITGLVVMADWIASSTDACPLSPEGFSAHPDRAQHAMEHIELTSPWLATPVAKPDDAYRQRFNWPASRCPRPLQFEALELVAEATDSDNALLIVEAPMGTGKTELALLCAEQLAERYQCSGIMVAAPTMATANGLFDRVTQWAEQAMQDEPASLFLAHSKAFLNKSYQKFKVGEIWDIQDKQALHAHQWLSGRKKGILSNAVVGTIDQVLFMALQSKHMMLRHLGLAQKVVVIDEVHAVDTYMASYLKRALTWLGHYKTPVILLSATLPEQLRAELIAAYSTGRLISRNQGQIPPSDDRYPVLSFVGSKATRLRYPESGVPSSRVSITSMEDDEQSLRDALKSTVEFGGCTAVICSTVDRAQHSYGIAKELVGDDAVLLHSRFAANQRVEQELELLEALGPAATKTNGCRPTRKIIIATQVIEQSLDIDVDFMITDIAPSDLVLQRSGRLHRHQRPAVERPEWASAPRILVRGFSQLPTPQHVEFVELVKLIYPEALLMASTVALGLLKPGNEISIPEQIPGIVRETYNFSNIPELWLPAFTPAHRTLEGKRKNAQLRAGTYLLGKPNEDTLTSLFGDSAPDIGNDPWAEQRGLAQVRDSDVSIEVILIQGSGSGSGSGYRILPWLDRTNSTDELTDDFAPSWDQQLVLAASTVQLPRALSYPNVLEETLELLLAQTPLGWQETKQLKDQLALRLDEDFTCSIGGKTLEYSREFGLRDLTRKQHSQS